MIHRDRLFSIGEESAGPVSRSDNVRVGGSADRRTASWSTVTYRTEVFSKLAMRDDRWDMADSASSPHRVTDSGDARSVETWGPPLDIGAGTFPQDSDAVRRALDGARSATEQARALRHRPGLSLPLYELATERCRTAIALCEGAPLLIRRGMRARLHLALSRALKGQAELLGERGRPDLALHLAIKAGHSAGTAVSLARQSGDLFTVLGAMIQQGWCLFRQGDELQMRLGRVAEAIKRYDDAVEYLRRSAALARTSEMSDLAEAMGVPLGAMAIDGLVTAVHIETLAGALEQERLNRPTAALRRYDKAAAAGLRAAGASLDAHLVRLQAQALASAAQALRSAAGLLESSGTMGATRRSFVAAQLLVKSAEIEVEQGHQHLAAEYLVEAAQAIDRSVAMGATRAVGEDVLARASDLASQIVAMVTGLAEPLAEVHGLLAAGRVALARGRAAEALGDRALESFSSAAAFAARAASIGYSSPGIHDEVTALRSEAGVALRNAFVRKGRFPFDLRDVTS